MKKKLTLKMIAVLFVALTVLPSCATVFGGKVTTCQKTKPAPGEPSRPVRPAALIADILLFWPGTIVDFATGAIYKPCDNKK